MPDRMPAFGRVITAMVTPFNPDGSLSVDGVKKLARYLVDELGNDGLVVNGTTGEAPTTTDQEKAQVISAVVEAVGDRAAVVAGVGTFSTEHSRVLARQAEDSGADGVLLVTPYYSRPPADALEDHFVSVADASSLPVMLYDIPHRSGTEIPEDMLIRLGSHPRITAVKDAKQDATSSATVIANTTLDYYAGDDGYTLPLLSVGGVGVVGTSTHFTAPQTKAIVEAFVRGRVEEAQRLNAEILPVFRGVFATQGAMMVKAALEARGLTVGPCRPPMGRVAPEVLEGFLTLLERHLPVPLAS